MKGVITLCGSTRFFDHFRLANLKLTVNDWVVLSIGIDTKNDQQVKESDIPVDHARLDKLHKEKIRMSNAIMVIDVNGYIGESTRSEIEHAKEHDKAIYSYTKTINFANPQPLTGEMVE